MLLFLTGVLIALCVSALCSISEAVLLSLTPSQVADINQKNPKAGKIWQAFKAKIDRPIAFILILNTAAHTVGAFIAGSQFSKLWGEEWIWLFSLIFTFAMLQFTEILPKSLGVQFNTKIAPYMSGPLSVLVSVTLPLIRFVHWLNSPFRVKSDEEPAQSTVEEIRKLASMARLSSEISPLQADVISGAAKISETRIKDVMIPVDEVSSLNTSQTIEEALIAAENDSHTRFPVLSGDDENKILGYINFKDLVSYARRKFEDASLEGIIRPLYTVTPNDSVEERMKYFIEKHIHIALVKDEDGNTLGLVTLEDLMEELVGEVEDEFDRLPKDIINVGPGTWIMGGGVSMKTVSERLNLESGKPGVTLNAWLNERHDVKYKTGMVLKDNNIEVKIRRLRKGHIFDAFVKKIKEK